MQPPSPLPIAARQAAWSRLWQALLSEPPKPPDPPDKGTAAGDEPAAGKGAA